MSSSRLDHLLSSLISILYLFLLATLPLLFSMKSSEVFEFPKMLFVYVMTTLIVACWIGRMIVSHRIIYARTPLDIPIYLFLLSQLLSTLFSIDLHTSIHGYYSRWNGGLLSTIAYTLLYSAYISNRRQVTGDKRGANGNSQFATRSDKSRLTNNDLRITIYVILASATIVSIYAILQRLGIDKDLWIQDVVSRVFSTQGQPNWLAAYLVMVMPFAWASTINNEQKTISKRWVLLKPLPVYCLLFIVFSLALFFTRSRSGLLGFVVADLTFWSVMVWNYMLHQRSSEQQPTFSVSKKQYRLKTIVHHLYSFRLTQGGRLIFSFISIHSLILVLVLLTNNPAREFITKRLFLQPSSFVLHPSSADALDSSITPSADIRKIVWTGAIELVKQHPFFGWGPETFAYTYWRVRPIEHNLTSEWNFLYNKAHNEWLNLAANSGLIGLGTHLLLLGWFTVWSLRRLFRSSSSFSLWPSSFILATLSALLGAEATNLFGFSTVTTQAYSYLFMGIAVIAGTRDEGRRTKEMTSGLRVAKNERIPLTTYCLLLTTMLSTLYLLSQISISFLADLSYNRGKQFANAGYVQDALADLESSVGLIPSEPVFRSELAETQGVLAVSLSLQDEEGAAASSLKDSSLENFRIVDKQSPANVSFLRTRAQVTYALGSLDPSLYDQGIELMERAVDLAPTDPKILYNLGVILEESGRKDEARQAYDAALNLKPDYEDAKTALGLLLSD